MDAAHARDLQLEAWVNPYRIQAGQTPALCGASPARLHPTGSGTPTPAYLDPASADVRQYIADGVGSCAQGTLWTASTLTTIFTPTTDPAFDAADYAASGSTLTQDDWRRENVNALMALCHAAARRYGVRFGAAPAGDPEQNYTPAIQRRGPLAAAGDCGLPDAPALLGAGIYKKRRCVAQLCAAGRHVGRTARAAGVKLVRRAGGPTASAQGMGPMPAPSGFPAMRWPTSLLLLARLGVQGAGLYRYGSLFANSGAPALAESEAEAIKVSGRADRKIRCRLSKNFVGASIARPCPFAL